MAKPAKSKTPKPIPFDQQCALRLQEINSRSPNHIPSKDAVTPPEDVIQHSKDVITPSGDAMDVSKGAIDVIRGNGSDIGDDCTKMVALSENKKDGWHENPYLPTQPRLLGTKEQDDRFLKVLGEKKYIVWAAIEFGCSYWTVQRRMMENPEFAAAVHKIRAHREEMMLATIEEVSETQAIVPSKVTDRAMQLNALGYGKYKRDAKGMAVNTQVNIMIGFTPPKHKGM